MWSVFGVFLAREGEGGGGREKFPRNDEPPAGGFSNSLPHPSSTPRSCFLPSNRNK